MKNSLSEQARQAIAQKPATAADESSELNESGEFDERPKPVAKRRRHWLVPLLGVLVAMGPSGCSPDTQVSSCPEGQSLCGGDCVPLSTSEAHCGACGVSCQSGQTCQYGTCSCQEGLTACSSGCVDLFSHGSHCGACGQVCAASEVCSQGSCQASCAAGLTRCGQSCVDTATSGDHCGSCNSPCAAGSTCSGGVCVCEDGETLCNNSCTDPLTDNSNCGACGVSCQGGEHCSAGSCVCPAGSDCSTPGTGGNRNSGGGTGTGGAAGGTGGTTGGTGGGVTGGGGTGGVTGGTGGLMSGGTGGIDGTGGTQGTECTITLISQELGHVQSVGIVEFSHDLETATSARIEFTKANGDASDLTYTAPVTLQDNNRTLLLGMAYETEYSYTIYVGDGSTSCSYTDTITTGSAPDLSVNQSGSGEGRAEGFYIAPQMQGNNILIWNHKGEVVWSYSTNGLSQPTRARLSYDGSMLYVNSLNVQRSPSSTWARIAMDGSDVTNLNMGTAHHDFTVTDTPSEGVVYIRGSTDNSCDSIYFHPDDSNDTTVDTLIYDFNEAFDNLGGQDPCHANSVHNNEELDTYTVSFRPLSSYASVTRSGSLEWTLGTNGSITGETWNVNHGHQMLDDSTLLLFNNNGQSGGSDILTVSWSGDSYSIDSRSTVASSGILGDVIRLPGGNTFTVSSAAQSAPRMVEFSSNGSEIQGFDIGQTGYVEFRESLYGAPYH